MRKTRVLWKIRANKGAKRKEEERSPECKVENIVTKEKFVEEPENNQEKDSWEEVGNSKLKHLSETEYIGEGMETLLAHIIQMQEDMKELKEGMLGKMGELIEGLRAESVRKTDELDERISNLEVKNKEKDQKYEEILNRMKPLEERNQAARAGKQASERAQEERGKDWNIMERKLEENERRARRNNLMITGLKMETYRLKERLEHWIEKELQVTCKILKAWKVKGSKEDMIGMECDNGIKWQEIMMNKEKLKGTEIDIERDLTWNERDTRRKLKEFAKEHIQKDGKAITRDTHAIIDGQIWKWNELENKPFQAGKTWKRIQGKEGEKKNTDTSMEHSRQTWLEEKDKNWLNRKLNGYDCTIVEASREKRKGRVSGGILLATKKNLRSEIEILCQEVIKSESHIGKEEWKIILAYMNKEKDNNWRKMRTEAEEMREGNLLLLGDMNARTGREGGDVIGGSNRNLRDSTVNAEGHRMLKTWRNKD
ncbi:hypothetical protein QAD02_002139 [Eretmocerus hayati]|uniref:Uncharacterized protein n=1 Tax=Eretmocerus hayati TaxID=131215 RepID=A0ACC2NI87_9HYME|nr:hypothetical protein QAD02_002139 [Eretmocerus hayati]